MDIIRTLVQGYTWKARMSNDAVFEFWTPYNITAKQARIELLKVANGDYSVYAPSDMISVWKTKGH